MSCGGGSSRSRKDIRRVQSDSAQRRSRPRFHIHWRDRGEEISLSFVIAAVDIHTRARHIVSDFDRICKVPPVFRGCRGNRRVF